VDALEPKTIYRVVGGAAVVGVAIIALAAMTGGRSATVTGRVTLQGRPVICGSIVLVATDGRSAAGRIEPDGSFTVANAPTGDVTVTVASPDPLVQHYASQIKTTRERVPVTQWAAMPVDRKQWFVLPKKYEDSRTSDLKLTIKGGRNECDVTLQP
jgi:hypothetical protein